MTLADTMTGTTFTVDLGKYTVETVRSVSGLSIGQDVVETQQITPTGTTISRNQPGRRHAGKIKITRTMDSHTAFTDWVLACTNKSDVDGPQRQNISITMLDAQKKPMRRFKLSDAWASKWEGPNLDDSSSDAATETITVVYEDITVE